VYEHAAGVPGGGGGSRFIGTTYDAQYATCTGADTVYVISNPGCGIEVDCDPECQQRFGPNDTEAEIVFENPIPGANILGWYTMSGGGPSTFQACP
jgi:hypothetical protein